MSTSNEIMSTALYQADIQAFRSAVEKGADINAMTPSRRNLLMQVCTYHHRYTIEWINTLVELGCDLHYQKKSGNTVLSYAIFQTLCGEAYIHALVTSGATFAHPIFQAIYDNDIHAIQQTDNLDQKDTLGRTVFTYAIALNRRDAFDAMLEHPQGKRVLQIRHQFAEPLAACITQRCDYESAKYYYGELVKYLPEEHFVDSEGRTMAHLAALVNKAFLMPIFLAEYQEDQKPSNKYPSIDQTTIYDETPLLIAILNGKYDVVKWILTSIPDCNRIDKDGESIEHAAARYASEAMCKFVCLYETEEFSRQATIGLIAHCASKKELNRLIKFQEYLNTQDDITHGESDDEEIFPKGALLAYIARIGYLPLLEYALDHFPGWLGRFSLNDLFLYTCSLGKKDLIENLYIRGAKPDKSQSIARVIASDKVDAYLYVMTCYDSAIHHRHLLHAAEQNALAITAYLIEQGLQATNSALISAAKNDAVGVFKYLYGRDLSINFRDSYGNTLLHVAALNGAICMTDSMLYQFNLNAHVTNHHGLTPLYSALSSRENNSYVSAIIAISEHGGDLSLAALKIWFIRQCGSGNINIEYNTKETLLFLKIAQQSCNLIVDSLMLHRPSFLLSVPKDIMCLIFRMVLVSALKQQFSREATWLENHVIKLIFETTLRKKTQLIQRTIHKVSPEDKIYQYLTHHPKITSTPAAFYAEHYHRVCLPIERVHSIEGLNSVLPALDATPLTYAAAQGLEQLLIRLIKAGVDVNHCDRQQKSAIYRATEAGEVGIIDLLKQTQGIIYRMPVRDCVGELKPRPVPADEPTAAQSQTPPTKYRPPGARARAAGQSYDRQNHMPSSTRYRPPGARGQSSSRRDWRQARTMPSKPQPNHLTFPKC